LSGNRSEKNQFKAKNLSNYNPKMYQIIIQCPDCGEIFSLNEKREYFCRNCNRVFSENEIRKRCGL